MVIYDVTEVRVLYTIKHEELYILSCEKGGGRRPRPFLEASSSFIWKTYSIENIEIEK